MRKFLSLALALVMVLSLTLVSASAKSFTDNNDVDYNEAVDVISALNIVDGYPDGSFNPSGLLTRQAAAKIICNLILGPTTAASLKADTAPFYDVPVDNGFAGYIAYCASRGIIGGYGDGSFQPGGYLSGNAFMKMLLGALGYDATIEEFVGPNWSINVGKLAMGIGLTDDLEGGFDGSKTVNRQEAALYALNTLQATMVDYGQKIVITDANGNAQVVGHSDAANMGEGQYASYDNHKTEGGAANATLQFCERYFEDLKKTTTSDDFERPAHTWKIKTTEVGTYVDSGDLIATWTTKVTKDALYNTLGKSVVDDLKSTAADCANATLDYYVDGETMVAGKQTSAVVDQFAYRKDTDKIYNDAATTGNGALTEVYLDKDTNAVTIVTINTYVFQASSDYNSSRNEVKVVAAGDTAAFGVRLDDYNLDGDDFDIADVKEDDYLLLTAYKDGGSYKVASVEPAEAVNGEVTAYTENDKVTVDGGEYSYSLKTKKTSDTDTEHGDIVKSLISSTGGQVSLIMDKYGYVIAIDDTVTGGNYVFIMEAASASNLTSSKAVGHAFFPDGTVDDITIKKLGTSTSKGYIISNAKGWYTYSKDSSGSYTLTAVKGSYKSQSDINAVAPAEGVTLISNGSATMYSAFLADSTVVRGNERTIYVIEDSDGDVYTYTGISNAPTVKVPADGYTVGYVWNIKNSYATYVFISVDGNNKADVDSSTENDMYVFLLKLDSTRNNGTDTIYRYKAIVDGEETTIDADSGSYTINKLYTKVKIDNNNDLITDMKELDADPDEDHGVKDSKYHQCDLTNAKFVYKNGVLSITSAEETEAYVIPSTASLNIVINGRDGKNHDLLVDKGADYEVHEQTTGSSLAAAVSGYLVKGWYYVVTKDSFGSPDYDRNVKTLYVFVDESSEDDGNGGTPPVDPATSYKVEYKFDTDLTKVYEGTVQKSDHKLTVTNIPDDREIVSAVDGNGDPLTVTNGNVIEVNENVGVVTITTKETTTGVMDVNVVLADADKDAGITVTEAKVLKAGDLDAANKYMGIVASAGDIFITLDVPSNVTITSSSVAVTATQDGVVKSVASVAPTSTGIIQVTTANMVQKNFKAEGTISLAQVSTTVAQPVKVVNNSGVSSLTFTPSNFTLPMSTDATSKLALAIGGIPEYASEVKIVYKVEGLDGNPTLLGDAGTGDNAGHYVWTGAVSGGTIADTVFTIKANPVTATGPVTVTIKSFEITKVKLTVSTTAVGAHKIDTFSDQSVEAGVAINVPTFDVVTSTAGNIVNGSKAIITYTVSGVQGGPKEYTTTELTAASNKYTVPPVNDADKKITPDGSGVVTITIKEVKLTGVSVAATAAVGGANASGITITATVGGTDITSASDVAVTEGKVAVTMALTHASDVPAGKYIILVDGEMIGDVITVGATAGKSVDISQTITVSDCSSNAIVVNRIA